MKKTFLALATVATFWWCYIPGDDIEYPACWPNQLVLTGCQWLQNNTKIIQFYVTQNFQGCDKDAPITLWFDLHASNGGVVAFTIEDDQWRRWDSWGDRITVNNLGNLSFTWTVTVTNQNVEPELDGITVDEITGQEEVFDDVTIAWCTDPCIINAATHEPCNRTDANTVQTKIIVLSTLQNCGDITNTSDIGVTINAPWGIASYKLWGSNGGDLEDENGNETLHLTPGDHLAWGIHTNIPWAIPTVQVRRKDPQGNIIVLHTYTLNDCPRAPPCENQITGQCNILSNGNKHIESQVTFENCTPFSADICYLTDFLTNTSTDIHWVLVNTQTGDIVQLPNNGRAVNNIRITVPAWTWKLSVQAQAKPGTTIPVNQQTLTKIHFPNIPYNQQNGVFEIFSPNDTGWSSSVTTPTNDWNCN